MTWAEKRTRFFSRVSLTIVLIGCSVTEVCAADLNVGVFVDAGGELMEEAEGNFVFCERIFEPICQLIYSFLSF